ncbi:MAG: sugar phosphate isomerase/epimerase family protein [Pseudomonadota bacterium]|nr:sugar phosphate isomerase/epimerase family protein [Pseudomonadota bacterium]
MKIGVITDGISRDFEYALNVMTEFGLKYAELQFLWDKQVGDLDASEVENVKSLLAAREILVSSISHQCFSGLSVTDTSVNDTEYRKQIDIFKRCVEIAQILDSPVVRMMGFRREMVLFGSGGAEHWNVAKGAWDCFLDLVKPVVEIAEHEGLTLVLETETAGMTHSAHLSAQLNTAIGSKHFQILWDPANCLFGGEAAFPDGYDQLKTCLGHVHLKDNRSWLLEGKLEQVAYGTGDMSPYLSNIASALRNDGYDGGVSLESVFRPQGGSFEDGFRQSIPAFLTDFG